MDKEIVTRVVGPGELVILILTVLDEFNSLTRTVRTTIIQKGCPLRILNAQGSLKRLGQIIGNIAAKTFF